MLEIMPVAEELYDGEAAVNWTPARRALAFNEHSLLVLRPIFEDTGFPGLKELFIDNLQNMNGLDLYEDHRGIGIYFSASF